jgi:DinB family protein
MKTPKMMRDYLVNLLDSEEAHTGFDAAVAGVPAKARGRVPKGLPYSAWQLLEHIRLAQRDILDYCRNKNYVGMNWPDDYWPKSPTPPSAAAWAASVRGYRSDRDKFVSLIADPNVDLFGAVPSNKKHTLLREVLLAADHLAYHLGQLMYVRRLVSEET